MNTDLKTKFEEEAEQLTEEHLQGLSISAKVSYVIYFMAGIFMLLASLDYLFLTRRAEVSAPLLVYTVIGIDLYAVSVYVIHSLRDRYYHHKLVRLSRERWSLD